MAKTEKRESSYKKIYKIVLKVPEGKIATYGQVARLAGLPGHARQVGYALHALPDNSGVPWFRVVNSKGQLSFPVESPEFMVQAKILEAEGIEFDCLMQIDLQKFGWKK
jgi:methylated-DNA-protein-cysteine methyltransferase-like protein